MSVSVAVILEAIRAACDDEAHIGLPFRQPSAPNIATAEKSGPDLNFAEAQKTWRRRLVV